jgi:NitT/TauT family transport system substrate-binding protein
MAGNRCINILQEFCMRKFFLILSVAAIFSFISCGKSPQKTASVPKGKLRVATGLAVAYSPFYVMEAKKILETKYLPDWEIELSIMGNSTAMSEALAAGRLDMAVSGPPQVLIAWDKGVAVKILCGLAVPPYGLMTKKPNIKSLGDFISTDKIAVPSIGSMQSILLGMACEKYFGDAHALDNNLLATNNPDAALMVMNGQIAAHFTPMPWLLQEHKAGLSTILTSREAFGGDVSGSLIYVTKQFHDENPLALAGFYAALCEAMTLVNNRDPEAMQVVAGKLNFTVEEALEALNSDGILTTMPYGVDGTADFMYREGYISKKPALEDILWEPALAAIGKRSGEPGILEQAQKRGE